MRSGRRILTVAVALTVIAAMGPAGAGWRDLFGLGKGQRVPGEGEASAPLSLNETVQGLKAALSQGVDVAVAELGKKNGFLTDELVRIAMPEELKSVEKTLRRFGQGELADEFVLTMNRAAEQAVPATAEVFGETVKAMSFDDAMGILNGPDDAATQYFRATAGEQLKQRILPIVQETTEKAGVTSSYKQMMAYAAPVTGLLGMETVDLDGYVTDKALDGLFLKIAEEEKRIRDDPVARTTDLLRRVFGFSGS
jgi:hypothetical protein